MKKRRVTNLPPLIVPNMPTQVEEHNKEYVATIWVRKPDGGHQKMFAKGEREEGGTALVFKDWEKAYPEGSE